MIVRISSEGQYELLDGDEEALNVLDIEAVAACQTGDERQFHASFARLLEYVRANGQRVADDRLAPSDLILPPPDVSLDEAKKEFTGEGLIPG